MHNERLTLENIIRFRVNQDFQEIIGLIEASCESSDIVLYKFNAKYHEFDHLFQNVSMTSIKMEEQMDFLQCKAVLRKTFNKVYII